MAHDVHTLEVRAEARNALRNVRETRRCPGDFEMRDVPNGTGGNDVVFTGYASVTCADHDDESAVYEMGDWLGPWTESFIAGAFRKTLSESADVAFLVNHEGLNLARTKPGTLKLAEHTTGTPTGLHSEARLDPHNPMVVALRSGVERGDLDEMSLAFRVVRQEWDEDYTRRWINEVNLNQGDVSLVNYGANPHTAGTVALRRAGEADIERLAAAFADLYELREGKAFSAAASASLRHALSLSSTADNAVDELQGVLSDLMGVPNPDTDAYSATTAPDSARGPVPDWTSAARMRLARLRAA